MDDRARAPGGRAAVAIAVAALIGILVVLSALLDLGPFADDELSRAELIARGDEICERAHDGFVELQAEQPRTAREAQDLTARLVGIAEDERDEVDELDGPDDLDALVDGYLDAREDGIAALRAGHDAAEAADAGAYADAQTELTSAQAERRRLAREVGFRECSRPLELPD
ncbi:MAG: hypothetical protein ACRDK9_10640 [Solirubrobacterales bacterium]